MPPQRPQDVLRELADTDLRGAVWCAALCASTVSELAPSGCAEVVRLGGRWGRGSEVSEPALQGAIQAAQDARSGAYLAFDDAAGGSVGASVALAAANASGAAVDVGCAIHQGDPECVANAVEGALHAAGFSAIAPARARRAAAARHQQLLAYLVSDQLHPTPLGASTSPLGDWLVEHSSVGRVGTLGDALDRARRADLRWEIPEERALAERFVEVPAAARDLCAVQRKRLQAPPAGPRLSSRRGARPTVGNEPSIG